MYAMDKKNNAHYTTGRDETTPISHLIETWAAHACNSLLVMFVERHLGLFEKLKEVASNCTCRRIFGANSCQIELLHLSLHPKAVNEKSSCGTKRKRDGITEDALAKFCSQMVFKTYYLASLRPSRLVT